MVRSNEKSLSRSRLHSAGLRNGIMASGSKNQLNMSHSSFNFHSRQPPTLPGEATGRSLASASKLATHIEGHVKAMKITDYYDNQSDSIIRRSDSQKIKVRPTSSIAALNSLREPLNGKGNLIDYEFPIKILDGLIQKEEQEYGFSLYNRGQDLKKSLIDPTKVRNYLEQVNKEETKKQMAAPKSDDWGDIMNFFKANPKALLDAIPTPRADEEKLLKELKGGMTPKGDMKFNDSSLSFKNKNTVGLFGNYSTGS